MKPRAGKCDSKSLIEKRGIEPMPENIFEHIVTHRTSHSCPDQHFEPPNTGSPIKHRPGTAAKMDAMRARLERGEPLWVDGDRNCFDG